MLLTPHIVRTHELTQEDLSPIYIGTQQNIALSGPPPLIAAPQLVEIEPSAPPASEPMQDATVNTPSAPPGSFPEPRLPDGSTAIPTVPPGSSPVPGTTTAPLQAPQPAGPFEPTPAAPPAGSAVPPQAQPPEPPFVIPPLPDDTATLTDSAASPPGADPPGVEPSTADVDPAVAPSPLVDRLPPAQVILTPPGSEFRVGGGPYIVPLSITGASQVSDLSVTLVYSPSLLRVRSVQEGSFMRQGGITATFSQAVDPEAGRVDVTITRVADRTGASGSGLLAAILFEAITSGAATVQASGVARTPSGGLVPLTFAPIAVNVQ